MTAAGAAIRAWVGLAALMAAVTGCQAPVGHPAAPPAPPQYVRDPGFPGPSGIQFATASWVTVDAETGLVWVLQRGQPAVSLWRPDGRLVSSWATDQLGDPHSLTIVGSGAAKTIWITDMAPPNPTGAAFGHCLKRFSPAGAFLGSIGVCGQNSQGTGLNPLQFDKVTHAVAAPGGKLMVADGDIGGLNNRVLTLTPNGQVQSVWSAPGNRPGTGPGQFDLPHALAMDVCGRTWVADTLNHRVQVIAPDGTVLAQLREFGQEGVYGLAIGPVLASGASATAAVYITTSPTTGGSGTALVFSAAMNCSQPAALDVKLQTRWPVTFPPSPNPSPVAMAHAVAVDPASGDVYIAPLGVNLPPQKWTRRR